VKSMTTAKLATFRIRANPSRARGAPSATSQSHAMVSM